MGLCYAGGRGGAARRLSEERKGFRQRRPREEETGHSVFLNWKELGPNEGLEEALGQRGMRVSTER